MSGRAGGVFFFSGLLLMGGIFIGGLIEPVLGIPCIFFSMVLGVYALKLWRDDMLSKL